MLYFKKKNSEIALVVLYVNVKFKVLKTMTVQNMPVYINQSNNRNCINIISKEKKKLLLLVPDDI